ncbi:unnamed protein product [Darwinula stevensoni]|uniref:UNC93-like protein n=1 Tax=Darwinula stevensoni TaxID=69355 RepID=A0A7R8XEC5_9CRUS|nr:unnamed protein product [Darwinula stevensoni]CAG0895623.1 unnamed protein product [Darwinula stevensoni]
MPATLWGRELMALHPVLHLLQAAGRQVHVQLAASFLPMAFVSCAWGTHNIGYVLICYGVVDALCSLGFGYLIKLVGRIPIFVLGALINAGVIIVLFTWAPNPDNVVVFFVLAGGWGMADAVWQTQINALYGVLFPDNEEAAFSNYRLWESVGFIIAYVLNNVACVYAHTWVVVGFLAVGMGGYFVVEFKERFSSKTFKLED